MAAEYSSKHGIVRKAPAELFMTFADMRNFVEMLPADSRQSVKADYDTVEVNVQGFNIGVKIQTRTPYSFIEYRDNNAPFHFNVFIHFDRGGSDMETDFWIEVSAELNLMMKMMLGGKIKSALDKIVDGLVDPSSISVSDIKDIKL